MDFRTISHGYPLLLASASPRRRRLLEQIGLPFKTLPSSIQEEDVKGNPALRVRTLAEKKATAVGREEGEYWVLGADTLVITGNRILGKPGNHEEARSMLLLLSGKEHKVVTGFCILDPSGGVAYSEALTTRVRIKSLDEREMSAYIATGEPFGKAGGYAIQGIGAFMVESISGSYTNVVGLPVCALIKGLIAAGALKNFPFETAPP